jgi:hypothetical protein
LECERRARGWLTALGNDRVGRAGNGNVEAELRRGHERREQGTPRAKLGERGAFAERDGLGLALCSCSARADTRFCGSTREPEQRELQGSVREPGEKQVASAEDHRFESNTVELPARVIAGVVFVILSEAKDPSASW